LSTRTIHPLPPRDQRHLLAAEGWLELGNPLEATAELEEITPTLRGHPHVLEIRWGIYAHCKKWEACVEIANALVTLMPDHESGWIHRSYALHELKRTLEAFELLLPAASRFADNWNIPYNLACYCAQLGRISEAEEWFKKAMALDEQTVRAAALDDPDLEPLWKNIGKL